MLGDNLAEAVGRIVGNLPSYKDGTLTRRGYADNGKGTMTRTGPADVPVKVQVDQLSQFQRPEGFSEDDVRVIVLASGLDRWLDNGRLQDDDEVTVPTTGITYRLAAPTLDPMSTHWVCRGRIKPTVVP